MYPLLLVARVELNCGYGVMKCNNVCFLYSAVHMYVSTNITADQLVKIYELLIISSPVGGKI